jgi:hypothetical protein
VAIATIWQVTTDGYNAVQQERRKPMDIQNVVAELSEERNQLDRAIAALESLSQPARRRGRPPNAKQTTAASSRRRGGITLAGRKRLSEMMKKRWAERRRKLQANASR